MWFIACCFPVWLVGTINGEREKMTKGIERYAPKPPQVNG